MTEALAIREQERTLAIGPPSPHEWANLKDQALTLARSNLVPGALRGKADDILIIALTGRELGLPPMAAINKVFVVDGRPTLSAELMVALVQREGHELWLESSSGVEAVACGKRAGSDRVQTVKFTMEEAVQAGVAGKSNWKKYPAAMLRARAISALCRFAFADVLMGHSYTPEELGAEIVTNEDGKVLEAEGSGDVEAIPKTILDLEKQIGEEKLHALANELRVEDGQEPNVDSTARLAKAPFKFLEKLIDRVGQLLETGEIGEVAQAEGQVDGSDSAPSDEGEKAEVVDNGAEPTETSNDDTEDAEVVEDSAEPVAAAADSADQESEGTSSDHPPPSDSDPIVGLQYRASLRAHENKGDNAVTPYKSCKSRVGFTVGEACLDCGWEPTPNPCPHCGSPCLPWTSSKKGAPKWRCSNPKCEGGENREGEPAPWVSWRNDPWKPGGEIDEMDAAAETVDGNSPEQPQLDGASAESPPKPRKKTTRRKAPLT